MTEIGAYALRFALAVAALGLGAGIYAGITRRQDWTRVAERAVLISFGATTLSILAMFWALAYNDFQLAYVAQHSARSMELEYRLAALWGGQAGSLLLWLWMVLAYGASAVWLNRKHNRTLMPWVCACLLLNAAFFLVLTNFVTPPFEKLPPAQVLSDGNGLNPLLQHPLMSIHPLMLYGGFTGFVVPFSFALAAMITGELGTQWFRTTRRWTLFAWSILGVGLLLGGRWAYEVLGWGGYWAWDPVENAALMPWIAGTAYLHSVMIQEKRDMLKTWNLVLIGLTYGLCLFGTFLTRSGVVQSVHSFTNSGWFGFVFLAYVVAVMAVFLAPLLYRLRKGELASPNQLESMVSREAGFIVNNWIFMALLVVVFWGTLLPVFTETFFDERTTVGPKFFNSMTGPIALILLFLTGVGPLIAWRRASVANIQRQFTWPALFGTAVAIVSAIVFWGEVGPFTLGTWGLGAFTIGTVFQEYWRAAGARVRKRGESPFKAVAVLLTRNQRRYGGYIVHLGVVLLLIGVSGAAFNEERLENIKPGDSMQVQNYRLEYLTANAIPAQHYGGAKARIAVYQNDRPLKVMTPEKRMYWLEKQPTSVPSIHSTLREDLYLILSAVEPDGSATLKIYRNPLVNWIWIGGMVFVLGNLLVMWPHPDPRRA